MKNKKVIYFVLIPIVIAIWGYMIYEFISFGSTDNTIQAPNNFSVPHLENAGPDTFSISADYRDPFLGKPVEEKNSSTPKVKAPPTVKAELPWPKITYGGVIKNQKSSKQLYLVQVSGNDHIMREGDAAEDVQLAKAWKDSIQVLFQKEKKVVRK